MRSNSFHLLDMSSLSLFPSEDREKKAQRGPVLCSELHSQEVGGSGFEAKNLASKGGGHSSQVSLLLVAGDPPPSLLCCLWGNVELVASIP